MNEISIFKGIDEQNVKSMLKCFEAKTIVYKKDTTVISNLANTNIIGIGKPEENEYISNEKLCNYLVNKFIFKN